MTRRARIRVPGSTSNLGSAFDAVGLALGLHLRLQVQALDRGPSRLVYRGQGADRIPLDESNLVWSAMKEFASRLGADLPPFEAEVENDIPVTKGLGSSASAYTAAAAAAAFLCGRQPSQDAILEFAAEMEGHPDNAAPSLLGGLVASMTGRNVVCARGEFPPQWSIIAVTPDFELETKKARAALPATVPHADAVYNVQRAAFLMTQLARGCRDGVAEAMKDRLHQPYRAPLIPGLEEILAMEPENGLIGVALSGAGPTVVAFADARPSEIAEKIRASFAGRGTSSEVRMLRADNEGLRFEVEE